MLSVGPIIYFVKIKSLEENLQGDINSFNKTKKEAADMLPLDRMGDMIKLGYGRQELFMVDLRKLLDAKHDSMTFLLHALTMREVQ